jgi:hypothetical protein
MTSEGALDVGGEIADPTRPSLVGDVVSEELRARAPQRCPDNLRVCIALDPEMPAAAIRHLLDLDITAISKRIDSHADPNLVAGGQEARLGQRAYARETVSAAIRPKTRAEASPLA